MPSKSAEIWKYLMGHFGQFLIHSSFLQNFGQPNKISPQNFSYQKHHFKFISKKREKNENSLSAKKFRDSVDFGWVLDDVMRQLVTLNILVWSRTGSDNRMEVRIRDVFNFIRASLNIWVDQIFCPRLFSPIWSHRVMGHVMVMGTWSYLTGVPVTLWTRGRADMDRVR